MYIPPVEGDMRIKKIMEQNKDTTVWSGVSLLLAMGASSEILSQVAIAILAPSCSWLLLYYVKKIIAKWEGNREDRDNNQ